jgi:hypothetical protein
MASKIADVLGISLDYLVGRTDLELDTLTLKRIQDISKMADKEKDHVYALLDAFIAKSKMSGLL